MKELSKTYWKITPGQYIRNDDRRNIHIILERLLG